VNDISVAYDADPSVLQPAFILPSQLPRDVGHLPGPEMQLVAAIFEDALHCIIKNVDARQRRRRREFLKAYEWVLGDDIDWPFAFRNVCDLLGLDPTAVRERLRLVCRAHAPTVRF
jgi:hypothetical protein